MSDLHPTPPNYNLLAEDFVPPVGDDNPAPSPLHVWDGESWLLPAEVELAHLEELDVIDKSSVKNAKQRLGEQKAALTEWEEQNATD